MFNNIFAINMYQSINIITQSIYIFLYNLMISCIMNDMQNQFDAILSYDSQGLLLQIPIQLGPLYLHGLTNLSMHK